MNRPRLPLRQRFSRTAQATACVCVTLLLLLSWLAVDPAAHARLHAHDSQQAPVEKRCCPIHTSYDPGSTDAEKAPHDNHDDSLCVVTAFAGGAPGVFSAPLSVHFVSLIVLEKTPRDFERIAVVQAALHPPSCGPPGAA